MGTIKTTNIEPIADNGTVTLGSSGDTFTVPSGVTVAGAMSNTPYFYGELASNQTLTRASYVKITGMTNNELDNASAFDGTTFTVPSGQAGKYYLEGVMTASYGSIGFDGEQSIGALYKNGSAIKESILRSDSSNAHIRAITCVVSGIFNLSVGDTIELYGKIQDASGQDGLASGNKTSLQGFKIIGA